MYVDGRVKTDIKREADSTTCDYLIVYPVPLGPHGTNFLDTGHTNSSRDCSHNSLVSGAAIFLLMKLPARASIDVLGS